MVGRILFVTLVLVVSTVSAAPVPKAMKKPESEAVRKWRESGLPPTLYPEIDPEAEPAELPEVKIDGTEVDLRLVQKQILIGTRRQIAIVEQRMKIGCHNGAGTYLTFGTVMTNVRLSAKRALDTHEQRRAWLAYSVHQLKHVELTLTRQIVVGDFTDWDGILPKITKQRQAAEEDLWALDLRR